MVLRKARLIITIICMMNMMSISLYPCLIVITNDTDPRILILNKEDDTLIPLAKYEKRRFGNPSTHARFDIYIPGQSKRVISKAYTCEQNRCNGDNIITLKFSDIKKKNRNSTKFFTITEYDPSSSMAQQVVENMQCTMCESEN